MLENYLLKSKSIKHNSNNNISNTNNNNNRFDEFYSPQSNKKQIMTKQFETVDLQQMNRQRHNFSEDNEDFNVLGCLPLLNYPNPHKKKLNLSLKQKTHIIDEEKKRWVSSSSKDVFTISSLRRYQTINCNNNAIDNEFNINIDHQPILPFGNTVESNSIQQGKHHIVTPRTLSSMKSLPVSNKFKNILSEGYKNPINYGNSNHNANANCNNNYVLTMNEMKDEGLPLIKNNLNEERIIGNDMPIIKLKGSQKHTLKNRLILKCKNTNPGILRFIKC